MHRLVAGVIAFLALTSVLVALPVYAAPSPAAQPVEVAIDEVALGSVTEPAQAAEVSTDGEPRPGGVSEEEATAPPAEEPAEPAPADEPAEGPATEDPAAPDSPGDETVVSGEELPGVPALTYAEPDSEMFSSVGVTWRQAGVTDVVVQLRVKDADGNWGEWTTLDADDVEQTVPAGEEGDARGGTIPYWTGEAHGIEVIVQGAGGMVPDDVKVALIDPGESAADALPLETGVVDEANAGTTMPNIIGRAQWGADESIRFWDPEYAPTLKAATLHHTADRNNYAAADVPGMMRSIYAYHTQSRGWGDIGYNFIVDKFGRTFEGRYGGVSSTVVGAHAGGFNTGTFGVSMLGNYAEVDTPQVMLEAVASVMAWKLKLYGLSPYGTTQLVSGGGGTAKYAAGQTATVPTVFAHRDVGNTTCPGQYAYNRMGQLRDMIAARSNAIAGSPSGNVESLKVTGDRLDLVGWAYDPDAPASPISVGVSLDGGWALSLPADLDRPDVDAAKPGLGPAHGFTGQLYMTPGRHTICVVFVNTGSGANTWMTCQVVTAVNVSATYNPVGNLESLIAQGRTVKAIGWAVDPDALSTALEMHAYVDGRYHSAFTANQTRNDIAAAFPGAGAAHGWTWEAALSSPGTHTVCIYAINRNRGTVNPLIRCASVVLENQPFLPIGHLDSATVSGRVVTVSGWALDQDTPTQPLEVQVTVNGQVRTVLSAANSRADLAAAFPGAGPNHGFSGSFALGPGRYTVCAYAINRGAGRGNPSLSCGVVSVEARAWEPVGNLEAVTARSGGRVDVRGWSWDPDAGPSSNRVHLYVDGRGALALSAAGHRPDVAAAYPEAGPGHGFSATLTLGRGRHTVCAYSINVGLGGANTTLGCRAVTVP